VHTLAAIDGAFYGEGSGSWAELADRLRLDGLICPADQERIQIVWDFGRAILNTDMHFGNLGFYPTHDGGFALAPIYDMLPMAYAPNAAGLPEFEPAAVPLRGARAGTLARHFWESVYMDARFSDDFRNIARLHLSINSG
jgi:hypothetical protein